MKRFRREVFLFRMLATIFAVEAAFLVAAFIKCPSPDECPDLGARSEQLFGVAIATTLSLIGAQAINTKNE